MFSWDEKKRRDNIIKHGIDFGAVWDIDWESTLRTIDARKEYGEERYVSFVQIYERLHVLVHTERNGTYRIISLRKVNKREEKKYAKAMDNKRR